MLAGIISAAAAQRKTCLMRFTWRLMFVRHHPRRTISSRTVLSASGPKVATGVGP
jgi:hypothetical protein